MTERDPKVLGDVLTYLGALGYDHLYVSQPSSAVPRAEIKALARSAPLVPPQAEPPLQAAPPPEPARDAPPPSTSPSRRTGPPSTMESPVPVHEPSLQRAPQPVPQASRPPAGAARPATRDSGPPTPPLEAPSLLPEVPPRPAADERARLFMELERAAAGCRSCRLCETRQNVVFGAGRPDARLMLIGEGPGSEEDRQGLPFVGPAGALLTRIIEAIDLRRDQVYIANVVKCRPPRNRDPLPVEVAACRGFLDRQIALIQPTVLVALGRVAAQALLDTNASLGSLRGRWHSVQGVETRVTYHPAALLRNEKWKRPTWEDMKVVRDRLRGRA